MKSWLNSEEYLHFALFTFVFSTRCTYHAGAYEQSGRTEELVCSNVVQGRYVYVVKKTAGYLTLCEVEVFGIKAGQLVIPREPVKRRHVLKATVNWIVPYKGYAKNNPIKLSSH